MVERGPNRSSTRRPQSSAESIDSAETGPTLHPKVIKLTIQPCDKNEFDGEQAEAILRMNRTEKLLHALNNTISQQSKRIEAIDNVCNEFDHYDKERHNEELRLSGARIMFQKLAFAVVVGRTREADHSMDCPDIDGIDVDLDQNDYDEEIALICCALEMVYRGSRDAVLESMDDIGMTMVPVLSQLLSQKTMALAKMHIATPAKNARNVQEESRDEFFDDLSITKKLGQRETVTKAIVLSAVKILRSFARAGTMVQRRRLINQKDLLSTLLGIITLRKCHKDCRGKDDAEIVADGLSIIAFSAEDDDDCNSHIILKLADNKALVNVIFWAAAKDRDSGVRAQAAFALMNLVKAPRSRFTESQQTQLFDTLLALFDDSEADPRKYAGAALFNLAYSQEYNFQLACHQNGAFLNSLARILLRDPNIKSRSNAAWVVFYMLSGKASVAQMVGNHHELLDALAEVVCRDESLVKVPAAKALRKLSDVVTSHMSCHDALLAALVKAAEGGQKHH